MGEWYIGKGVGNGGGEWRGVNSNAQPIMRVWAY